MATPASGNSTSTSGGRWEGLKESGPGFSGFTRQRTTSNRGGRGGGGRGGRGGLERAPSSQGRAKVISVTAKATIAAELGDKPAAAVVASSRGRPGPPSRRGSRVAPSPTGSAAQASTKPSEQSTPSTAARPSNKRRRSHAGKGPRPKSVASEEPESVDNETTGSGQPRASAVPTTAPIHDTPPHLVNPEEQAKDIKNNLDALVERVRSVAIDRPITPSTSHIDWAGDEDDSLPDLDDWGITTTTISTSTQPSVTAQAMSPIIVSLRTLPDPAKGTTPPPLPKPLESPSKLDTKPTLSSPLTQAAFVVPPTPVEEQASKAETGQAAEVPISTPKSQQTPKNRRTSVNGSPKAKGSPKLKGSPKVKPTFEATNEHKGTSVADSIHAPKPTTAKDPLFGDIEDKDGLKASMWATEPSATSAPAEMPSYGDLPSGPSSNSLLGNGGPRGGGRGRHRGGAFSFDARNRRGGAANGGGGGGWAGAGRGQPNERSNHSRNQSSPSVSPRHNRPVITGDAISRLARTIAAKPGKSAAATAES